MKSAYLEAGKVVNTHGVLGEVKIVPWADSARDLSKYKRFFINGLEMSVHSARCHGDNLIVKFEGINDMDHALSLKDKIISIAREDAELPSGRYFIADLIGADVYDEENNKVGILCDILEYPASKIYVIKKADGTETLVPAVKDFVRKIDPDKGIIVIHFIEGM